MGCSETGNGNRYKNKYWKKGLENNKISSRHSKAARKIKVRRRYEKKNSIKK